MTNNEQQRKSVSGLRPTVFPRGTTLRSVWALLLREMVTNNAASFGGVIWGFLQPSLSVALLAMVFSAGFKSPPVGDNFAFFYATGIVPFIMYSKISGSLGDAVRANRKLLQYPRITVLDTLIARLIFTILMQTIVGISLYFVVMTLWDTKTTIVVGPIFHSTLLAIVLGFGVGVMNCWLFQVVPTWRQIWGIVTTPLFLLSCVIFSYDQVPQPFDGWLYYNPLVHVVALSRTGFYPGYPAHHVEPLYPLCIGLGLSLLGLILLNQGRARLLAR